MNNGRNKKSVFRLGWVIIFSAFFLASCVYDKEFAYLNDQIISLNNRVTKLQESIDSKQEAIDSKIDATNFKSISSNQAEMRVELDQLKDTIQGISGRVEDNEHLIKRTVERDLKDQDAVRAELVELALLGPKVKELEILVKLQYEYLDLEPSGMAEDQKGDIKAVEQEGAEPDHVVPGEETKSRELELYDRSLALFREGQFEQAVDGFKSFLNQYPKSDRADNGQFWIGECLMALKQYEQAILAYQEVIKKYPKGNKVPNAMLRQAVAFLKINDTISSKLLLQKVIKQYPKSSEAKLAKTKLKTIK
ncbi:MAG: tol-pal system protein YbgF [Deltaproteobacteria bacterium]|nr:tol-pal system protein YbgF [Deltaproteobacteria bacterium]